MKIDSVISRLCEDEMSTDKRTYKNLPRYATGKPKVPFQKWLGLKGQGSQGYDGKFYGWSHRAIAGFKAGDKVGKDAVAHKNVFKGGWDDDEGYKKHKASLESYTIKDDKDAKDHAIRFADEVS